MAQINRESSSYKEKTIVAEINDARHAQRLSVDLLERHICKSLLDLLAGKLDDEGRERVVDESIERLKDIDLLVIFGIWVEYLGDCASPLRKKRIREGMGNGSRGNCFRSFIQAPIEQKIIGNGKKRFCNR